MATKRAVAAAALSWKIKKFHPQNLLETFFAFLRQTMVGWGSPRAAQKKLATPPTRTPWFVGFFVISGGSVFKRDREKKYEN